MNSEKINGYAITEETEAIINELQQKINDHENFILNITHDLRGHLNVIISALQYMKRNKIEADENDIKYMNIIKRNSFKMLKLINNLIDTNKLENNYYSLDRKNIDIVPMIEGTVGCIAKYAGDKNIELIFDTNEEECITSVDPEAIDRIIMNLLSNAIKFSPAQSNIYVCLNIYDESIEISIKDEGKGISQEDQERIFDRFYQSKTRIDRDIIGSGIGLDLTNYLVKAHYGEILLNSKLGEGSEFIVRLPRKLEENIEVIEKKIPNNIQMLEIEFSDIYLS